jgi:hypothetical protein
MRKGWGFMLKLKREGIMSHQGVRKKQKEQKRSKKQQGRINPAFNYLEGYKWQLIQTQKRLKLLL